MDSVYSVRGVTRTFRGVGGAGSVIALDGVDLDVRAGEVFGLLGPNGAGKTTLTRVLVGLSAPDAGRVTLAGSDVTGRPALVGRAVAYLPQDETALAEIPLGRAVETTGRMRGLPRPAARAAAAALLEEFAMAAHARRPVRALSGGQRRLAALLCALAGERQVLVLDEPTAGLDPHARRAVWDGLRRRRAEAGTTIVLVTHNVAEAEAVLDRVAVLERGRVIGCDSPAALKSALGGLVRVELVWRADPPLGDPAVAALAAAATVTGRRWSARLPPDEARRAVAGITAGPALAALDDLTLTTPSLEDVYLSLGGRARDLERV